MKVPKKISVNLLHAISENNILENIAITQPEIKSRASISMSASDDMH